MSEATNPQRCPFSRAFLRVFPPTSMQGAWASAASDFGNSEPALEASGLNTGLRYKVCASSLDHNGQERPRRWANKRVSSVKVSWCVQCCCGDQIWKFRNFVRWTWMEQAQLCTTWKRLNVESWWLWGAKPAGYSLFDIYVSGVVSASCLGIWRNFGVFFRCKPQKPKRAHILSDARHLGHFATCSPFITWCALQEIAGFWIMSSCLIMSSGIPGASQVQTVVLECLPEECSEAQKSLHWFRNDSNHCWWLVYMSKNGCFRHQPHFLQQASCFLKIMFTVYCLLLCTSTVHSLQIDPDTSRYIQIHGIGIDLCHNMSTSGIRYRSISKVWTKNEWQSILNDNQWQSIPLVPLKEWQPPLHLAEVVASPRPKALRCGQRRCPSCPPATPRGPDLSGNATDVRKRRFLQRRCPRFNHLGRSKVGSEFSFGRSLGSLGSLGTILLFQNFFVLSFQTFFADSQVDLTMGSHYRICVDMDGSRHPQKSIHPFVMKICMKTTPLRVKTQIYLANISNFS